MCNALKLAGFVFVWLPCIWFQAYIFLIWTKTNYNPKTIWHIVSIFINKKCNVSKVMWMKYSSWENILCIENYYSFIESDNKKMYLLRQIKSFKPVDLVLERNARALDLNALPCAAERTFSGRKNNSWKLLFPSCWMFTR